MFSMSGKICVVTGAGRGLGRGIALAYAEQGADVVLASVGAVIGLLGVASVIFLGSIAVKAVKNIF